MSTFIYSMEDESLYEILRRALDQQSLILFAGSGLSAQACTDNGDHPPLWGGLLEGLIKWSIERHLITVEYGNEIIELVSKGYLIEAGQELQEELPKSQLQEGLIEILLSNKAMTSEAHRIITEIPFRAYITTNYDELIEGFYRESKGVSLQKYYERTINSVLDAYNNKKTFVFKIHGDINDPDTIVLGNRSYEKLLYSDRNYTSCLETIINTSSFLFLGFGGSDPDLEGILSRCAAFNESKRHWLLLSQNSIPKLKAKRLWKDKGINVICYEPDENHTGVVRFLDRLHKK